MSKNKKSTDGMSAVLLVLVSACIHGCNSAASEQPPPDTSRPEAVPPMPILTDFLGRLRPVATSRADLTAAISAYSAASHQGLATSPYVDAAQVALKELPQLVEELQKAVRNNGLPAYRRLGAYVGLLYGEATEDTLPDTLGGYGYLDDWLVLSATRMVYVRDPAPVEEPALTELSTRICLCMPPASIQLLAPMILLMEQERDMIKQRPEAAMLQLFNDLAARPGPIRFAPMAGSGNGRSLYFQFDDGSSVGMTSSGKIVGGP